MRQLPILLLLLLLAPATSPAHEVGSSYLRLRLVEQGLVGQWDVGQGDLENALGLERSGEIDAAWERLRAREEELAPLLAERLALASEAGACEVELTRPLLARVREGFALLRLAARCPSSRGDLRVGLRRVFEADPSHRGYVMVRDAQGVHSGVLSEAEPELRFPVERPSRWRLFRVYLREGVVHIGSGADHVLFLISLLLPAALRREAGRWQPRDGFRRVTLEVLKVVSAFTVAHSLTLALAAFEWVRLPPRFVEAAIAASVVVAAMHNLRPLRRVRGWWIAFTFGLVHGLGFANVLGQLGLPAGAAGLALLAFNLGVEAGQLAIVAVALPVLYLARTARYYRPAVLEGGSLLIAWVAALWLVERAAGIRLLGWP